MNDATGETESNSQKAAENKIEIKKELELPKIKEERTLKRGVEDVAQTEAVTKKIKTTPEPIPQLKKEEEEKKNETVIKKPIEEIIDGSELRKFLNKNITPFLIKALNDLSERWQKGEYNGLTSQAILLKFSEIIKGYADKS